MDKNHVYPISIETIVLIINNMWVKCNLLTIIRYRKKGQRRKEGSKKEVRKGRRKTYFRKRFQNQRNTFILTDVIVIDIVIHS